MIMGACLSSGISSWVLSILTSAESLSKWLEILSQDKLNNIDSTVSCWNKQLSGPPSHDLLVVEWHKKYVVVIPSFFNIMKSQNFDVFILRYIPGHQRHTHHSSQTWSVCIKAQREAEAIKLPSLAENFSLRIQTCFCSVFFSHTP